MHLWPKWYVKAAMAAVVLVALLVVACGGPAPTPTPDLQDVIIRELAAKYGAIILRQQEDITYTLQAQMRLIADKPTLFSGGVDDVFHRNEKLFVRFSSYDGSFNSFVFELECSDSVVGTILAGQSFDKYVVVANIQDVSRPVFTVTASPLSEDEAEIEISTSWTPFIARGTCIDIASAR